MDFHPRDAAEAPTDHSIPDSIPKVVVKGNVTPVTAKQAPTDHSIPESITTVVLKGNVTPVTAKQRKKFKAVIKGSNTKKSESNENMAIILNQPAGRTHGTGTYTERRKFKDHTHNESTRIRK